MSEAGFAVVVLGSLHLDVMVDAPRLPALGETLAGAGWRFACGGKGGNQAVAAARAGARTAMVGRVGDDEFGRRLVAKLASSDVDVTAVAVGTEAGSGMSVAISEAKGDYAAVIVSGTNVGLGDVDAAQAAAMLRERGVLVLQNEVPEAANLAAARAARAGGAVVVLNAAPARPFATELAGAVDVLVANEVEAVMLGAPPFTTASGLGEAASFLAQRFSTAVVVTSGPLGAAVARDAAAATLVPVRPVEVVSTHGAGDVFVGAMAAELARGATLVEAAGFGAAAATLLVSLPLANRLAPQRGAIIASGTTPS